jgi:hypothetical protein
MNAMAQAGTYIGSAQPAAPRIKVSTIQVNSVGPKVLNSWKEIAVYLNRGVRTVQRWHCDLQLPVHKIRDTVHSPVFAFVTEIDQWLRSHAKENGNGRQPSSRRTNDELQVSKEKLRNSSAKMLALTQQQRDRVAAILDLIYRLQAQQKKRCAGSTPTSAPTPAVARPARLSREWST